MKSQNRILLVDDDESILESTTRILEAEGYIVNVAKSGNEAIKKFETDFYNLVVLDIKLPDKEGTEVLAEINKIAPQTIKIMLTGYPALDNAILSVNSGADAYIMKPVSPQKLTKVIHEKLQKQKIEEQIDQERVKTWIKNRVDKLKQSRSKG